MPKVVPLKACKYLFVPYRYRRKPCVGDISAELGSLDFKGHRALLARWIKKKSRHSIFGRHDCFDDLLHILYHFIISQRVPHILRRETAVTATSTAPSFCEKDFSSPISDRTLFTAQAFAPSPCRPTRRLLRKRPKPSPCRLHRFT